MLTGDRINLKKLTAVLVDSNPQALKVTCSIMSAFGLSSMERCADVEEAKAHLSRFGADLLITEATLGEEDGYALIHWLRRESLEANRFIPAVVLTGHTRRSQVIAARDCGASYTVAKPVAPRVLLERLFWAGSDRRMFIGSDSFIGPDRRFREDGVPKGEVGRRKEDAEAAAATAVPQALDSPEPLQTEEAA